MRRADRSPLKFNAKLSKPLSSVPTRPPGILLLPDHIQSINLQSLVDGDFGVEETEHQLEQMAIAPRPGRPRDPDRGYGQLYE